MNLLVFLIGDGEVYCSSIFLCIDYVAFVLTFSMFLCSSTFTVGGKCFQPIFFHHQHIQPVMFKVTSEGNLKYVATITFPKVTVITSSAPFTQFCLDKMGISAI
jgi:hypothetical protein